MRSALVAILTLSSCVFDIKAAAKAELHLSSQVISQADSPVTEQEAAHLADALIAGLEKTGDIRMVDRDLFGSSFAEACLAPKQICRQITPGEAKEFSYTTISSIWLVFEHEMSLQDIESLSANEGGDPEVSLLKIFPEEVRELLAAEMANPRGEIKTVADFREAMKLSEEIEKRMLEERIKHDHTKQLSYRRNLELMEKNSGRVGGHPRFSPVETSTMGDLVPKVTYMYVKMPFFVFVTKTQGKAQISAILPVSE